MENQEQRQPEITSGSKKENQKKRKDRSLPLPLASSIAVVLLLAYFTGMLMFWVTSYFLRAFRDLSFSFTTTMNMVEGAQERQTFLLDKFIEKNEHTAQLAGRMIELGLPEMGQGTPDWVFGTESDSFLLYDIHGNLLTYISELVLDDNMLTIYREAFLKYYSSAETSHAVTDFGNDLFFETLSDGSVLMYVPALGARIELLDSLYDVSEVLTFNADEHSLAFVSSRGLISAAPRDYQAYEGRPTGSVVIPRRQKVTYSMIRVYPAVFNSVPYLVLEGTLPSSGDKLLYLTNIRDVFGLQLTQVAGVAGGIIVCALIIMYFVYQSRKFIRQETEETRKETRLRANVLVLVSCVVIYALSYYTYSLYNLSLYTLDDQDELRDIKTIYEKGSEDAESLEDAISKLKESEARMIGNFLSFFPEARTKESLRRISEEFGLDYIILFDQSGNETVCSGDYINLSLATDSSKLSSVFRSLLNGKQTESTGVEFDDLSCGNRQLFGASLRTRDNQPDGLVLCADMGESLQIAKKESSLATLADAATNLKRNRYYMIDASTDIITYSPIHLEIGQRAENIGFTETELADGYSGSVYIGDEKFCISQTEVDGQKLYVALSYDYIYLLRKGYSLLISLICFLLFRRFIRLMERVNIKKNEDVILTEEKKIEDRYSSLSQTSPSALIASRRTMRFIGVIVTVYVLITLLIILFRRSLLNEKTIINYVLDGKWHAGPNIFALTAILIMVAAVALTVGSVRYGLTVFSRVVSNRALTYLRLLISAIDYLSVIFTAYFGYRMLGGDLTGFLAASSALALVIGMGAEDITKDIIAGVFLMFEGEFQIGDNIEVYDKIGTVKEVGLTTTKLVDPENNILILKNSDVRNLINHTLNLSYAVSAFTLSSAVSIRELEEIFASELPAIRKAYPAFQSTPYFDGVRSFEGSVMECSVVAQVEEKDRAKYESVLNREVKRILDRHEIEIG